MIQGTHFGSGTCMRMVVRLFALVAIALVAASCGNPILERRYLNEGAGVDLNSGDVQNQAALLDQYIFFICQQMGPGPCVVGSPTFVQAGMNDIDQRCDGYLTWLDARRRDQTPVLAEISAIQGATHDIMAITGASVQSLNIAMAAFTLATATYANWNSRLLISVNQSTVQEVVYSAQGKYRERIRTFPVPDQPTAIYLLRNYLRLCMPITIEAQINTSTTLVERGATLQALQPLVVQNTAPPPPPRIQGNISAPAVAGGRIITRPPPPTTNDEAFVKEWSKIIVTPTPLAFPLSTIKKIQQVLCVPDKEQGRVGDTTLPLIAIWKTTEPRASRGPFLDENDRDELLKKSACPLPKVRNAFERVTFRDGATTKIDWLINLLNKVPSDTFSGQLALGLTLNDPKIRNAITRARKTLANNPALANALHPLPSSMADQLTDDLFQALSNLQVTPTTQPGPTPPASTQPAPAPTVPSPPTQPSVQQPGGPR